MTRRVRHWKQRFNPEGSFVWTRYLTVHGRAKKPGQRVDTRRFSASKLLALWDARYIAEAGWTAPVVHRSHQPAEAVAAASPG